MSGHPTNRDRRLLTLGLVGGGALLGGIGGCGRAHEKREAAGEPAGQGVGAVEDLMREHGVLRRILIVYAEVAPRLAAAPKAVDTSALAEAAALFRAFGEDYHERSLEEGFVFPDVRRAGGPASALIDTLLLQHRRGREITDYVQQTAARGPIEPAAAEPLARALRAMVRMYEAHAAWEDTVLFPAWKRAITPARLAELSERFEQLEQKQFGQDGFETAVRRVTAIEDRLGVSDLGQFTAPAIDGGA